MDWVGLGWARLGRLGLEPIDLQRIGLGQIDWDWDWDWDLGLGLGLGLGLCGQNQTFSSGLQTEKPKRNS